MAFAVIFQKYVRRSSPFGREKRVVPPTRSAYEKCGHVEPREFVW